LRNVTRSEFVERAEQTGDEFAQTFIRRCDEFNHWPVYGSEKGCVFFTTDNGVCNLKLLHVFSDYERQGIGTELFNYVVEQGKDCDYFKVSMVPSSIPFYGKKGLVDLGKEKNYHTHLTIMKYVDGKLECVKDDGFEKIAARYM
jgi:GNAT superfamily N-acetyltransferase